MARTGDQVDESQAVRLMRLERGKWISNREAARVRIAAWATMYRALMMCGAPNPGIYNKQVFTQERIDTNKLREFIELGERWDEGLETDKWLQELRKSDPKAFEAVIIQHVEREPGGLRRLDVEHRVSLWKKRTGLGQTAFYDKLNRAEQYIGWMIGVS